MQHQIICGEYKTVIMDCATPRQAALNALLLWNCKLSKPTLSSFIGVTDSNRTVYITTSAVLQELKDAESTNNEHQESDRLPLA